MQKDSYVSDRNVSSAPTARFKTISIKYSLLYFTSVVFAPVVIAAASTTVFSDNIKFKFGLGPKCTSRIGLLDSFEENIPLELPSTDLIAW